MLLLIESLGNHNFIIPRPKQIIKREMPEMQRKIIDRTSADFLPGACRTGGGKDKKDSFMVLLYFLILTNGMCFASRTFKSFFVASQTTNGDS